MRSSSRSLTFSTVIRSADVPLGSSVRTREPMAPSTIKRAEMSKLMERMAVTFSPASGGDSGLDSQRMQMLKQIASALAAQFGSGCEVVIHDFDEHRSEPSIVHIENGHVTGRQVCRSP